MVLMKRGFSLFTMSTAMLLGVAGCSIASSPDTYFVVDLYGDYEGMEVDKKTPKASTMGVLTFPVSVPT